MTEGNIICGLSFLVCCHVSPNQSWFMDVSWLPQIGCEYW